MRDSRGMNRISSVFNNEIDSGSSSNLIRKSPSIDATILKERNSNADIKPIDNSDTKDGKSMNESNAQSASETKAKRHHHHQTNNELDVNDLTINLDLDEIDDDQLVEEDKCANNKQSENALSMDVDEPSEELYVSERYDRTDVTTNRKIKTEDAVTIESEEDSSKSNGADETAHMMNGTSKDGSGSSQNDVCRDETIKASTKSNKRKISISSDEELEPPSKR